MFLSQLAVGMSPDIVFRMIQLIERSEMGLACGIEVLSAIFFCFLLLYSLRGVRPSAAAALISASFLLSLRTVLSDNVSPSFKLSRTVSSRPTGGRGVIIANLKTSLCPIAGI